MKARYLKRATLEELRDKVPENVEVYRSGSFSHFESDHSTFFEGRFDINEAELGAFRMPDSPSQLHEEDNCRTCYEAMGDLTPYEARDERLWVYLTHTRLLEYTRERWPIPVNDEEAVTFIRTHFFAKDKRSIERNNSVSRLWWMAFLCRRVPELTMEEALQIFLYRADVRANLVERPTASQSVVVFSAIIKKLHTSYLAEKKLFDRKFFRQLMVRINSIGGIKLLDCMSEQQMTALIDHVVASDLGLASV